MAPRTLVRSVAAALLLAAIVAPLEAARATCSPTLLGADRRGPATAMSSGVDRLYVGAGAAVVVIDTTDLAAPVERGYANLDEVVLDVAHWATTVVALGEHGLAFVDAADPEHPAVVGAFDFPAGWHVETVTARTWRAYVPESGGLHVVDFSDPSQPVESGAFPATSTRDVVVHGDRAYLLTDPALLVLDVSDPDTPSQIASVPTWGDANLRLAIDGAGTRLATYGCVTPSHWEWCEVAFYALAQPDLPALYATLHFDAWLSLAVALDGNHAYVGGHIFDASGVTRPVWLGSIPGTWPEDLAVASDPAFLFVAESGSGLLVERVKDPANAELVASLDMPGGTNDGYLAGSFAITVHDWGLRVHDLTDPRRPVPVGSVRVEGESLDEATRVGSHAYVSVSSGVRLFDLTDPTRPLNAGPLGPYVHGAARRDGDLLVARFGWEEHLFFYDVSDPPEPFQVGALHLSAQHYKMDFTVHHGRLHVWDYNGLEETPMLRTFDVSQPASPVELGAKGIDPWHWARSAVRGRHLLAADEDRFDVFDVANPANPVRVATLPLPPANWYERKLTLYGAQALVAPNRSFEDLHDDRLLVLDVSDPLDPELTAAIETPGAAHGAFAAPGLIVVADGPAGISIYSSCVPFADGFESGDTSEWSDTQP